MLQALLNVSSETTDLRLDGLVGSKTSNTLSKLKPQARVQIEQALSVLGIKLDALLPTREGWIARDDLIPIIDSVSRRTGVPPSFLLQLVDVEAPSREVDGSLWYHAASLGPGDRGIFRGLTQMGRPAWADASTEASELGLTLPGYDKATDPLASVLAAALYAVVNHRRAKRSITSFPVLYLLHNQGPGAIKAAKGRGELVAFNSQSAKAQALILQGMNELV